MQKQKKIMSHLSKTLTKQTITSKTIEVSGETGRPNKKRKAGSTMPVETTLIIY